RGSGERDGMRGRWIEPSGNYTVSPMGSTPGRGSASTGSTSASRPGPPTAPGVMVPDATTSSTLPGTPGYKPPDRTPDNSARNQSLSMGMRQGVFGLKGLSLSTETNRQTPGPVIVSKVADVKLESGTQMLLKVLDSSANHP